MISNLNFSSCIAAIDACVSCPAGFYCTEGTANPVPCHPGTYQPDEGQPNITSCLTCTAGMACTTSALTAPDKSCDPGFVLFEYFAFHGLWLFFFD